MSPSGPDPYSVLGVAKDASPTEIKKTYRKLARQLHPDRGGDPEKLTRVNGAYEIVGDAAKRALYDEFGHAAFRPGFDPDVARRFGAFGGGRRGGPGGIDLDELMKMFGGGGGGPGGGFDFSNFTSFGGGGRGPRRGQDRAGRLTVTLAEALRGGERQLGLGSGKPVRVRIPKGVRSAQRLRVAGKGSPGVGGGPPGDLLLEVEVLDHPLVRIDRDDLEMDLPITFVESIEGGQIEVSTPTGTVKVKIPPRAEAGTRLRLKGRGLPKGGRGTRTGDLYLVLLPTPPKTRKKKALSEAVEALRNVYEGDVRAGLSFE